MYLKQIEQLVILQRVDNEILGLKKDIESAPRELAELEKQLADASAQADLAREKRDIVETQFKRLDGEIEEDNIRIRKSKNKLMMVGNTKEYHAMMREMDNLEKLNRSREEEKAALQEELTRQNGVVAGLESQLAELEANVDGKRTSLTDRLAVAEAKLAELNAARKASGACVPAPILGRYEFIRSRLPNPVIVPVDNGICGGCHISIPPQSFIELQKGLQILSCPNCQRLIFWVEHFSPEGEAPKTDSAGEAA